MTLRQKIESGRFIVTAELGPPQSSHGDVIRKKATYFRDVVDGVNITDNQAAIVRLSSIASAKIALDEGLEPIVQMTCRDRNRIAIQSDLLGASALGLQNVLCLTGDYPSFGNHPESRPVFDLDSIQLIGMLNRMVGGAFLSGEPMKVYPDFFIGGAANPFADPLAFRVIRLGKKIRAGARFIQTQPVFDLNRFAEWMGCVREYGFHERTAILAGVMPVKSVNALLYLKEQVPGMRVGETYIRRMEDAQDPKEEGVRMAVEIVRALREMEGVRGVHLMPLMWESVTPRIVEESGLVGR